LIVIGVFIVVKRVSEDSSCGGVGRVRWTDYCEATMRIVERFLKC